MNETIIYRIPSFLHSHICQFRLLWKQSNTLEREKGNSVFIISSSNIPTTLCNIFCLLHLSSTLKNSCHNIWCTLVWLARCRIGPCRQWSARPRRLNLAFQTFMFKSNKCRCCQSRKLVTTNMIENAGPVVGFGYHWFYLGLTWPVKLWSMLASICWASS